MKMEQVCTAYPSWCQCGGLGQRSKARQYNQDIKALRLLSPPSSLSILKNGSSAFAPLKSIVKVKKKQRLLQRLTKWKEIIFPLKSAEHCSVQARVVRQTKDCFWQQFSVESPVQQQQQHFGGNARMEHGLQKCCLHGSRHGTERHTALYGTGHCTVQHGAL